MNAIPMTPAHLCVAAPRGRSEALAALDAALHFQRMLAAIDVPASLGRQRLRRDAVNFVFGAQWGFDADAALGHRVVLVNTQMLTDGGAGAAYLRLLHRLPVIDIDAANVAARVADAAAVPLWQPISARTPDARPLAERPIELLMLDGMNARRAALIERIEAAGTRVARLETALVADERRALVRQARAVLWLAGADGARFDRLQAALALAEGTPVIAEGPSPEGLNDAERDSVLWFEPGMVAEYFGAHRRSEAARREAERALARAADVDAAGAMRRLWSFAQAQPVVAGPAPSTVVRVNADMRRQGWRAGWINVDADPSVQPDVCVDLGATTAALDAIAPAGSVELLHAGWRVVEGPGAVGFFDQALHLLKTGGTLVVEATVPRGIDAAGWIDELRADLADGIARRGWLGHKLEFTHAGWLSNAGLPVAAAQARRVRLVFTRIETSYRERTLQRSLLADFGLAARG